MNAASEIRERHNAVWLSLPWYLNGTLEPDENGMVVEHLGTCLTCRQELKRLQLFAATVRENEFLQPAPERSFENLMRRIEKNTSMPERRWQFVLSTRRAVRRVINRILPTGQGQRLMPAYAFIWALPALFVCLLYWQFSDDNPVAVYHTLSDETDSAMDGKGYLRLVVDKNVTVEELYELMRNCRVEITAGPSAVGAYTLRMHTGQSADTALMCLRGNHNVQFAEPVYAR